RRRLVRGPQQHDRHLVYGDLRRRGLRLQEARLPARAARARARPRRPRRERAPPEPDHVAGLTRDLRRATHLRRDHSRRDPVLRPARADAVGAVVGGAVVVWIAVRLVGMGTGADGRARHGGSLWEAIWIIIVADVTMSLDNVLAIAAASHGDLLLVMFGVGLSLPIVVWGAGLLAYLMNRHVWIVWLGGGLLGYVAGQMILEDAFVHRWLGDAAGALHRPVPLALAA